MAAPLPDEDPRLSLWLRVRTYAVPPRMIDTAEARRRVGDWAGACAAAGVDPHPALAPRRLARTRGRALADAVRADLRAIAPDLLRWHFPRSAPHGLLRPGLTLALARYRVDGATGGADGPGRTLWLTARTAPARAAGPQRLTLALWDPTGPAPDTDGTDEARAHPDARFRLDLHRHLWDADRAPELRSRTGVDTPPDRRSVPGPTLGPPDPWLAVDRWADEAALLSRDAGRPAPGPVLVRAGTGRRLLLHPPGTPGEAPRARLLGPRETPPPGVPVLPEAAVRTLPDLVLLRSGLIAPDRLHPLVAAALAPPGDPGDPGGGRRRADDPVTAARTVDCRGARHRLGLVDGVLTPLDHDPEELRRERLLADLTGPPLPCLRMVAEVHRSPERLPDVRERLRHGDVTGALDVVEGLLGPAAALADGPLREALRGAVDDRLRHGLYRAGLDRTGPPPAPRPGSPSARAARRRSHALA
ncbi:hypothetical protein ACN20G_30690 (plasmid) [Streptomyces sp. BI20]|uniref:hypothetical protein n=1 Tax=Streptomyces sp. BI20 TaxID=3403460 RepID=UPI003C706B2B